MYLLYVIELPLELTLDRILNVFTICYWAATRVYTAWIIVTISFIRYPVTIYSVSTCMCDRLSTCMCDRLSTCMCDRLSTCMCDRLSKSKRNGLRLSTCTGII